MCRVPVAPVEDADGVVGVGVGGIVGEGAVEADETDFVVDLGLLEMDLKIGVFELTLRSGREDILLVWQKTDKVSLTTLYTG